MDVNHKAWQGYEGSDFGAIVDLGKETNVSSLSSRYLLDAGSWVFLPQHVNYSISLDGINWKPVGKVEHNILQRTDKKMFHEFSLEFQEQPVRFIKVEAKNMGICPSWHAGAGGKAWLFVDEVIIK